MNRVELELQKSVLFISSSINFAKNSTINFQENILKRFDEADCL